MNRHPEILNRKQTALLIVDVQEKINAAMMDGKGVVANVVKLIEGCKILGVPIFITEQYPKGLGPTEPAVLEALSGAEAVQKMTFSCGASDELMAQIKTGQVRQIVITGIESHVCVQQTALDLIAQDFQVHLPKDAVSSRKQIDYDTALQRMSKSGVILTTVESVLFEMLEEAGTPEFKSVSKLIK